MDIAQSIEPRSDQINADDLIAGPQTYTIREVRKGAAESPFDFMLIETERAYRPSKTMRRMIVAAWGSEASNYVGKRLTLYREPSIMFGGAVVGGIRISHMSGIDKRVEGKFQVSRGKRETFVVDPLPDAAPAKKKQPAMKDRLTTGMKARGITEREDALAYVESIIGRAAPSSELSDEELAQVVEALEQPIGADS